VEGGLQKWSISLYRSSVWGTWKHKRRLWRWAPLSMRALLENLGEGSYAGGLCVEEGSGTSLSPYRGPIRGRGAPTGNFKNYRKGGSGFGASHSVGALLEEPGEGLLCWGHCRL